jgi:dihydrofolate reductase
MATPAISIIAAVGKNRELGKGGKLLWHIPEDMRRFKTLTTGHPVIMGRKTYESIGKPLPGRTNIVLTQHAGFETTGVIAATSLDDALQAARDTKTDEIFVIGGAQIYTQTIGMADTLYLTIVGRTYDADAFFPEYGRFSAIESQFEFESDGIPVTFLTLHPV